MTTELTEEERKKFIEIYWEKYLLELENPKIINAKKLIREERKAKRDYNPFKDSIKHID